MNLRRFASLSPSAWQGAIILLGIALRLRHYLEDRSFWQDEICLALSIVNRSFAETWQHVLLFPDFAQAPLLFQVIAKAFTGVLGDSEFSLRLLPFIAGIASLFLARRFFRRSLSPRAATLALALFALIEPLVYFSAELKSYGVDVLAALAVYEMFSWLKKAWTPKRLALFVVGGALVIWFSYAMLFVLAGCGVVLLVQEIRQRNMKRAAILAGCYLFWILSFILLYQLSLSRMLNPDLLKNWRLTGGFAPGPLWSTEGVSWAVRVFLDMFRHPLGMGWPPLAALFFGAGCYAFFRRDRGLCASLLLPFLITLFAGAFERYPFFERMLLFLVPSLLVVLAAGVDEIAGRFAAVRPWMAWIVVALVLAYPVGAAAGHALKPRGNEQNREAMAYLAAHYQPGDLIAVSPQAQYPFWYYGRRFGLNTRMPMHRVAEGMSAAPVIQLFPDKVVQGGREVLALRRTLSLYDAGGHYRKFMLMGPAGEVLFIPADDPRLLKGMGRVWVFLSHHNDPAYPQFVDGVFSKAGKRVHYLDRPGATVALYDIRGGG